MQKWTSTFWRHAGRTIAVGLALVGAVAAQAPLTLQQAVQEALRNSPHLRAAAAGQNKARAGVSSAQAGRLPRVDLQEGFTRSNNPVYVFGTLLTQQRFSQADFALPALNQPAPLNNFQTRAEVSLPIFDARQRELRVREAHLGEQVAGDAAGQARQGVLLAVISAYDNLLGQPGRTPGGRKRRAHRSGRPAHGRLPFSRGHGGRVRPAERASL